MTAKPRPSLLVPAMVGVLVAVIAVLVAVLLTRDDDGAAATTTTASTSVPSTTAPDITTTQATTTTTTTTAAVTTTLAGGIETVTNPAISGTPGPNLTDVRVGDHDGYVRIVFDLTGNGTPMYVIGYESPPFIATSGEAIPVAGAAFLAIHLTPASTYDIDTAVLTYTGDRVLEPGYAPVSQIVLIDDFEAVSHWVIGLDAQRPFTVDVLQDPLRVVIDIAK